MPSILVTDGLLRPGEGGGIGLLESAGLDLRFEPCPPSIPAAELIARLRGCVAVLAGSQRYSDAVFEGVPELRLVSRLGVGYDAIDLAAATAHEVAVTTTPGTLEWAVADHTFGLLLALAHHIPQDDRAIRRGQWRPYYGVDVWRKTLGIVGLGRIGRMVAQRARGFEMRILAHDPYADQAWATGHEVALVSLEELLGQSDFVTLHAPLTPETGRLMNAQRLALMKQQAYLINTSRGGLVDEDALYEALSAGRLAGAGLDVRAQEPPTDDRFAALENVVLTPHDSGLTDGRRLACTTMAAEAVLSILRGERPRGLVNTEVWERLAARLRGA